MPKKTPPDKFIVVIGEPGTGFVHMGPFNTYDSAIVAGEKYEEIDGDRDWWVVSLFSLSAIIELVHEIDKEQALAEAFADESAQPENPDS